MFFIHSCNYLSLQWNVTCGNGAQCTSSRLEGASSRSRYERNRLNVNYKLTRENIITWNDCSPTRTSRCFLLLYRWTVDVCFFIMLSLNPCIHYVSASSRTSFQCWTHFSFTLYQGEPGGVGLWGLDCLCLRKDNEYRTDPTSYHKIPWCYTEGEKNVDWHVE